MPGVNRRGYLIRLKRRYIRIKSVQSGDRKYHKEVLLPAKVEKPGTLTSSYKNGILEIKIK